MVGVNGSGKTTTVGKLARILVAEDRSVVLGAADTFRAAAVDQLATWGERVGVEVVRGPEGTDPASVAFEAVKEGVGTGVDTVIVDTAGRLQNKQGLMDELGKVKRVIEKQAPVTEVLLVLDATTGQNGLIQARVFREVVDVTGIVLTKLDGSAKGGIVVQVQRELGVPVKLVGLGEGADDLAPFDAGAFVDALLGGPRRIDRRELLPELTVPGGGGWCPRSHGSNTRAELVSCPQHRAAYPETSAVEGSRQWEKACAATAWSRQVTPTRDSREVLNLWILATLPGCWRPRPWCC